MALPGTATTFATTLAFAIAIKVTVAATATFHYMYTTLPYITSHDIALHEIQCGSCIRCILHCTQVQLQLPLKLPFPLPLLLRVAVAVTYSAHARTYYNHYMTLTAQYIA